MVGRKKKRRKKWRTQDEANAGVSGTGDGWKMPGKAAFVGELSSRLGGGRDSPGTYRSRSLVGSIPAKLIGVEVGRELITNTVAFYIRAVFDMYYVGKVHRYTKASLLRGSVHLQ